MAPSAARYRRRGPCDPCGMRLLQLVRLLSIEDVEGIQVLGAAHLELDNILAPLDLHRMGNLPPRSQKKVLNLADLHRLAERVME